MTGFELHMSIQTEGCSNSVAESDSQLSLLEPPPGPAGKPQLQMRKEKTAPMFGLRGCFEFQVGATGFELCRKEFHCLLMAVTDRNGNTCLGSADLWAQPERPIQRGRGGFRRGFRVAPPIESLRRLAARLAQFGLQLRKGQVILADSPMNFISGHL